MTEEQFVINQMECGKCKNFDRIHCRKDMCRRYEDEIVKDCNSFEYHIYYIS